MIINTRTAASIIVLLAMSACRAAAPMVRAEHVAIVEREVPGTSLEALEQGRRVLYERCAGCHSVPTVRARDLKSWNHELATMKGKAKLGEKDEALLRAYLAVATQPDFVEPKEN